MTWSFLKGLMQLHRQGSQGGGGHNFGQQVLLRLLGGGRGGEGGLGVERGLSSTRCGRRAAQARLSATRAWITGFLVGPLPVA